MNRCGYFAKACEQKEDSPKIEEGDSVPKPKKKRAKNPRQASEEVEWWEMLNWEEMKDTWKLLPSDLKEKIRVKGLAPKG